MHNYLVVFTVAGVGMSDFVAHQRQDHHPVKNTSVIPLVLLCAGLFASVVCLAGLIAQWFSLVTLLVLHQFFLP